MTHHWRELKVGTNTTRSTSASENYPSSSFTRLHNLTLCHFHKYPWPQQWGCNLSCLASPRPAPPFSLPGLLNTFFLQTTLNSICRSNESEKKGINFQLNFIDQILPSLLGERAFFPSKSHVHPPPTCYVLVWWTPVLWKFLFLHWFYLQIGKFYYHPWNIEIANNNN